MKTVEQATHGAADLQWLVTLLTGSHEIALDVTVEAIVPAGDPSSFFPTWMEAWSRRLVIAKALTAIREDLAASARRTALGRAEGSARPRRPWVLDRDATKSDLERALLSIDLFPRAAVLLLAFEGAPLKDAAILLDAETELVLKAHAAGVRDLTIHLARMQSWKSAAARSNTPAREWQHA
jgi:DNA-directed RNA polymerase specialized sigma24 family protein